MRYLVSLCLLSVAAIVVAQEGRITARDAGKKLLPSFESSQWPEFYGKVKLTQLHCEESQCTPEEKREYKKDAAFVREMTEKLGTNEIAKSITSDDPRIRFATAIRIGDDGRTMYTELLTLLLDKNQDVQQAARRGLHKVIRKSNVDFGPVPYGTQNEVVSAYHAWKKYLDENDIDAKTPPNYEDATRR